MADQDFNITIKTVADTTGIKLTEQGLNAIKVAALQGNQQAIASLKQLTAAQNAAASGSTSGFGSVVGIGTIVTLLTSAISKWKEFIESENKIIERMETAREKSREFGLTLADAISKLQLDKLLDTFPLATQIDFLKSKVISLATEMQIAFDTGRFDDAKEKLSELNAAQAKYNELTNDQNRKSDQDNKNRQKQQDDLNDSVNKASGSVQDVIKNEDAARKARQEGNEKDADMYQKTADQFEKSLLPSQQQELKNIRDKQRALGQSSDQQEDDITRNKKAFDAYWNQPGIDVATGQPKSPFAPLSNPPPNEDMIASPVARSKGEITYDMIKQAFDESLGKYFGP